jgi:AcrR family transcriptional regulator
VFVADPGAPIAAVAEHAGVGISALYRRYASKEELLRRLCGDGLVTYIAAAEEALADDGEPWEAFVRFMRRIVDADTHSLTSRLAGTFTPNRRAEPRRRHGPGAQRAAGRADQGGGRHPGRPRRQRPLQVFEQLASIRLGDEDRTHQLRHRYLALLLEAMHGPSSSPLPGPPPTWQEITARW